MTSSGKSSASSTVAEEMTLAGFWQRAAATILDVIVILGMEAALDTVLILPLSIVVPLQYAGHKGSISHLTGLANVFYWIYWPSFFIMTIAAPGAYYVLFESSRFQATPGKLVLGLRVTDVRGDRISLKRGVLKIVAQYVSLILIFAISLVCTSALIFVAAESGLRTGTPWLQLISSNLVDLAPLLVGALLYASCLVSMVFKDRKQTIFDKLAGRLVWTTRRVSTVSSKAPVIPPTKVQVLTPNKGQELAVVLVVVIILMYVINWVFDTILARHPSMKFSDLAIPLIIVLSGVAAAIFLLQYLRDAAFYRFDANEFIRYSRLRAWLLVGFRRKLWYDCASAVSKYVQGNSRSAEELLLGWEGKLSGNDIDTLLNIQLFGCSIASDTDGIIDVGQKMSLRPVFPLSNKLMVTSALFRKGRYKDALELLDTIANREHKDAMMLSVYFAAYYSRLGCERELNTTLAWLETAKCPVTNAWKLQVQGNCAVANGNADRARDLLMRALEEFSHGDGSDKPQTAKAAMSLRAIKSDLAKLENQPETDINADELSVFRPRLKQIAKRMGIAAEEDS